MTGSNHAFRCCPVVQALPADAGIVDRPITVESGTSVPEIIASGVDVVRILSAQ